MTLAGSAQAPLPIVHLDDALIVLDKPANLLSVPGRGPANQDSLSLRVQARFPEALIVHRLDMGTSGLFVMARSLQVQRQLSADFAARRVHKRYVAVVQGLLQPADGAWRSVDAPLLVDWPNRPRSRIDREHGKPSLTRWRVIGPESPCPGLLPGAWQPAARHTVVDLAPLTGRSHQLRVHLLSLGHPVAGDTLYGDAANQAMAPRLLLHACELELIHPLSGQPVRWQCPTDWALLPGLPQYDTVQKTTNSMGV